MRFLSAALCTTVAAALLASCSGSGSSPSSALPSGVGNATKISQLGHHAKPLMAVEAKYLVHKFRGHVRLVPPNNGLYAQQFLSTTASVQGYAKNNSGNGPPICAVGSGTNVNGFGTDAAGNLIVPAAFSGIQIYNGPGMCGSLNTTITDSYGQAADGAAQDAINGTIVVGHASGIVTACSISSGCTALTLNDAGFSQVAMDKAGNCYANAFDSSSFASSLWYFAGCTGTGVEQTGFSSPTGSTGGIDIDNKGNVVSTSQGAPSQVEVWHCASGACTSVAGPTPLNGTGDSVYCHLGKQNERLACGNASTGTVDVYSYLPSRSPAYMYSFSNGLSVSNIVEAAAYNPRSPK
jgi:hypothetical protein